MKDFIWKFPLSALEKESYRLKLVDAKITEYYKDFNPNQYSEKKINGYIKYE